MPHSRGGYEVINKISARSFMLMHDIIIKFMENHFIFHISQYKLTIQLPTPVNPPKRRQLGNLQATEGAKIYSPDSVMLNIYLLQLNSFNSINPIIFSSQCYMS